ncbi:hypothetical protein CDAR_502171 [Caerostris darwini]|uniref:Maturase K n=1 Tax=Caerostris darwini TaxID=1538125 RepID=A0AAV4VWD4_9ARAC|nr:hypothetical protein CDAR_502171 [Caerostris darwini]
MVKSHVVPYQSHSTILAFGVRSDGPNIERHSIPNKCLWLRYYTSFNTMDENRIGSSKWKRASDPIPALLGRLKSLVPQLHIIINDINSSHFFFKTLSQDKCLAENKPSAIKDYGRSRKTMEPRSILNGEIYANQPMSLYRLPVYFSDLLLLRKLFQMAKVYGSKSNNGALKTVTVGLNC